MENPRDVKLTRDKMFVLCDISPCVHVLSHAGEMTRSLLTRGDGMQVYNAQLFCLDTEENLLISDSRATSTQKSNWPLLLRKVTGHSYSEK